MPDALVEFLGYIIYFWSDEYIGGSNRLEPIHVHVAKKVPSKGATKFWITHDGVVLAHNKSKIPERDLKKIKEYIALNRKDVVMAWFTFFGQGVVKEN